MASWHALAVALATLGNAPAGETVLLDFTAPWCGPCKLVQPTVQQLQREGYPVRVVDFDSNRALAARYNVTQIPCLVLVVDGREVDRALGPAEATPQRLRQMLHRAGARPQSAADHANNGGPAMGPDSAFRGGRGIPARPVSDSLPAQTSSTPLLEDGSRGSGARAGGPTRPAPSPEELQPLIDRLMAASARIRVTSNGQTFDTGSGTVIGYRQGEALILTCGHIFRDSAGKGRITVDFFGPDGERGVSAQMIGFDLRRDVGLIVARPARPITPAPVAAVGYNAQVNETVINIGCDHGQDATAKVSRITSIDKYLGPPNLQVAGQPEVGRSGGGLFNLQGEVIGVCNAKDPEYNEGLYAALASIHAELDRHDMQQVYDRREAPLNRLVGSSPPEMPSSMPISPGRRSEVYNQSNEAGLTSDEAAAMSAIQAHASEITLLVRTSSDIADGRRGAVLSDLSPQFLRELAAWKEAQQPQSLTTQKDIQAIPPQPSHMDQGTYPGFQGSGGRQGVTSSPAQGPGDMASVPPWRRSPNMASGAGRSMPASGNGANLRWRPRN